MWDAGEVAMRRVEKGACNEAGSRSERRSRLRRHARRADGQDINAASACYKIRNVLLRY